MVLFAQVCRHPSATRWHDTAYVQTLKLCVALLRKNIVPKEIRYQANLPNEMQTFFLDCAKKVFGKKVDVEPFNIEEGIKETGLYFFDEETFQEQVATFGYRMPQNGHQQINLWRFEKGVGHRILPACDAEAWKFQKRQENDTQEAPALPVDLHGSEQEELLRKYAEKSTRDDLTGVWRRDAFEEKVKEFRSLHPDLPCVLLLFDLDNLHKLNAEYGYTVADNVIKSLVASIKSGVRKTDIVGRYGGDEFLLFLTGIRALDTKIVLDRIYKNFHDIQQQNKRDLPPFSVSVGASRTEFSDEENWYELVFLEAEAALKQAKKRKGGCVAYKLGTTSSRPVTASKR